MSADQYATNRPLIQDALRTQRAQGSMGQSINEIRKTPLPVDGLAERLEERQEIKWNAPDKDGNIHSLVDPADLSHAIAVVSHYGRLEVENTRLKAALATLAGSRE